MLSFQQLQEKKTKIKINPKKEEMMEKSDVIDSGTSTEELYDSQEEVVEESSEESETQTTLLTFEERAARKMTLRNLQTLKKKTIPAAQAAEKKRKKEGKGEYSAAYKKKETDVTNYDDKAPAKKAAPKKKAVASVKKATPKAAPKKSEPKAKAKPAPKKAAPKPVAKKEAPKPVAKKETPKSKSVGDKARDWVKKGIKRHRKATQGARVFGKGFAKGVKTAVKVAKDVKKVVSEGKTYSQFMKEMNNFDHSASQRGAWSIKGGFKFGKGTGQNKHISLNVGTGDNTSTIASYQKTSTVGTGKYKGNEVSNALNKLNQIQHGGDGGWSKEDIAKEVAKEQRFKKTRIASTGGPNSYSSKIRQEEVELKTMNELFGLFKGRGQSGGNTGGGTIQRGGYNHAKSNAKSGNNPVLGFARNLLGNKQNVSPTAKFYQNQKKKNDMLQQLLNQETEHEGEEVISERQKTNQGERKSEESGRSDYGKISVRNTRKFGKPGEPAVFDLPFSGGPSERGKMITQRRTEHKAKRGVKTKGVSEGVGKEIVKGFKRHKDAVEKKKIKNRKAVPYAALAAGHTPKGTSLNEVSSYKEFMKDKEQAKARLEKKISDRKDKDKLFVDIKKKGIKFYDKKGSGRIQGGRKKYD